MQTIKLTAIFVERSTFVISKVNIDVNDFNKDFLGSRFYNGVTIACYVDRILLR